MLAAGDGRRVGHDTNKVLLPLAGRRVFTWAVRWATTLPQVSHVVLVIRDGDQESVGAVARELPTSRRHRGHGRRVPPRVGVEGTVRSRRPSRRVRPTWW